MESKYIYIAGVVAATYLIYPFWLNRIFMNLMLWQPGVSAATQYINKQAINYKNLIRPYIYISITIILLAGTYILNKDVMHQLLDITQRIEINKSPLLEIRHFASALALLFFGVLWHKLHRKGFNKTIGLTEFFAPISYCLYISCFFLKIKAAYLDSTSNKPLEYLLYLIIAVLFLYVVERLIYPPVNKGLMSHIIKKIPAL